MKLYEISDQGLQDLLAMEMAIDTVDFKSMYKQREPYRVEGSLAYIHVFGPLIRNASPIQKQMSLTDYQDILDELNLAENDSEVHTVVMSFDSPGGESAGSEEVALKVQRLSKPVIGIVDMLCASAAYKIASSCSVIYSTISGQIGSIGSIIIVENTKQAMNALGINKQVLFNSGAIFKSTAQDFGSLTADQHVYLQAKVDESAERFQDLVLTNRPEINPITFTAAVFSATDSLEAGLIDGIISLD